ncbi:cytochrome P450 [Nocardia sp. NPDC055053]
MRTVHQDGHVGWLITSHRLAREMLVDDRFSARSDLRRSAVGESSGALMAPPLPGQFISMDRPEHTRYRRLLTKYFTSNRLDQMTPWINDLVAAQLDILVRTATPADLVAQFAMPIPSMAICELLGVPGNHRELVQQINYGYSMADSVDERNGYISRLYGYLSQLIKYKRLSTGSDLLVEIIADNPELTDEELLQLTLGLVLGGHETTANMISLGVFALLEHPDQLHAMIADPANDHTAVSELLRYLTVTHIGLPYRAALEDVDLGGAEVRKGDTVTVALPAANRDRDAFTTPDDLDVRRTAARGHLAFGHGAHRCLGQHLAELELRIAYRQLFERLPSLRLAVDATQVPMRTFATIYGPRTLPVTWDADMAGPQEFPSEVAS